MISIWKYKTAPRHLKNLAPAPVGDGWVLEAPPFLETELDAFLELSGVVVTFRRRMADGRLILFGREAGFIWREAKDRAGLAAVPAGH